MNPLIKALEDIKQTAIGWDWGKEFWAYKIADEALSQSKPESVNDYPYSSETEKLWDWHSTAIPEDAEGGAEEIAELVAGKSIMYKEDFEKAIASIRQSKEGEVPFTSPFIRGYNCEGKKAAVSDAVEFAEWLAANSYEYMGDGKWFHDVFKEPVTARHTSEQLYNLFLEQSGQKQ